MIAASSLSTPSSNPSTPLLRDVVFRRCFSLPPLRPPARTANAPRFSATCAAAPERERGRTGADSCYCYNSRSCSTAGTLGSAATLYDVLGITVAATPQEIKEAYRRLARACHPDVLAMGQKEAPADEFMRVHAAYATLSDPGKRAEYDRRFTVRRTPHHGFSRPNPAADPDRPYYSPAYPRPPSSSSNFSRRTWETDQCW